MLCQNDRGESATEQFSYFQEKGLPWHDLAWHMNEILNRTQHTLNFFLRNLVEIIWLHVAFQAIKIEKKYFGPGMCNLTS